MWHAASSGTGYAGRRVVYQPELIGPHKTSSALLGSGEGCGEPVEGEELAAEGAGAEDEALHDLQFVQGLVEGHPGAGAFGSSLIMVAEAWARAARVTWRCQPV
jgi:hypothetical protein